VKADRWNGSRRASGSVCDRDLKSLCLNNSGKDFFVERGGWGTQLPEILAGGR
jgi:hypothetical protein